MATQTNGGPTTQDTPHEAFCRPRPQSQQQGALTPLLSNQPRRCSSHSRPASTSTPSPLSPRTCLAHRSTPPSPGRVGPAAAAQRTTSPAIQTPWRPDPPAPSSPDEHGDEDEVARGRESGSLVSEVTVRREPLTPFPPWRSNSDSSRDENLPHSRGGQARCGCGCGDDSFSRSMHAVVLALESVVFLGVVCLFGGISVWRGGESAFWTRYYILSFLFNFPFLCSPFFSSPLLSSPFLPLPGSWVPFFLIKGGKRERRLILVWSGYVGCGRIFSPSWDRPVLRVWSCSWWARRGRLLTGCICARRPWCCARLASRLCAWLGGLLGRAIGW